MGEFSGEETQNIRRWLQLVEETVKVFGGAEEGGKDAAEGNSPHPRLRPVMAELDRAREGLLERFGVRRSLLAYYEAIKERKKQYVTAIETLAEDQVPFADILPLIVIGVGRCPFVPMLLRSGNCTSCIVVYIYTIFLKTFSPIRWLGMYDSCETLFKFLPAFAELYDTSTFEGQRSASLLKPHIREVIADHFLSLIDSVQPLAFLSETWKEIQLP